MNQISILELGNSLEDTVTRVSHTHERVVITKNGKPVGALISIDDLSLLERLEDEHDVHEAAELLARTKTTMPFAEFVEALEADIESENTEDK